MIYGWFGAFLEVVLFMFTFSHIVRFNEQLQKVDPFVSYWLGFTVLTGFWEIVYLSNRKEIDLYACYLIENKQTVWKNKYGLSMVLPWNLSKLFYADYGAWADREYKTTKDEWSSTIEGSHCLICGCFSLLALWSIISCNYMNFGITLGIAMGSQFMNSLVYMSEYCIQTHLKKSVNYNSPGFPTGTLLINRPFIYINYFWLLFPAYAIYKYTIFLVI